MSGNSFISILKNFIGQRPVRDAACELNISPRTLENWLQGHRKPAKFTEQLLVEKLMASGALRKMN